jgi:DNA-binding NarL/FixJ family response regulator
VRAIHSVANGEAIFSPKVAERLITYFGKQRAAKTPSAFSDLTKREGEILELIAQGLTNTAIAERLMLPPKTVRNHVSNIFSKLQISNRAQAIIRAREAGMGKDENNG